jgi:alpha-tubulin suppressor-like RCC1 family protein
MAEYSNTMTRRELLYSLLTKDRSLYTSYLPREIVSLVLDYSVTRLFVVGANQNGKLGTGDLDNRKQLVELGYHPQDAIVTNDNILLLINGDCYISGRNGGNGGIGGNGGNRFGIDTNEEQYLIDKYPGKYIYRQIGKTKDRRYDQRYTLEFINLSELKREQLGDQYIIKIASSELHTLILTNENKCYSFGSNAYGAIGIGDNVESDKWNLVAENVIDIECGFYNSCYLTKEGEMFIFGYIKIDVSDWEKVYTPRRFTNYSNVSKIFLSDSNIAFIHNDNLYVYGDNSENKLGFDAKFIHTPTILLDQFDTPLSHVQKICFARGHTMIIANNQLYICGSNDKGQLGLGDIININRVQIMDQFIGKNVTDIATYEYSSYVVADKICYATGANDYGALGLNEIQYYITKFTPMPMFTSTFIKSINRVLVRSGGRSAALIIN